MAGTSERVLLKNGFVPAHYGISIEPDLTRFTFDGSVTVRGEVRESTNKVILHAKELLVSSASFLTGDKTVNAIHVNLNLKATTVELVFPEALPVGPAVLKVSFVGQLNNQMAGFYRSSYTDINGNKKIMASTQFEPIDARRAFPCVDEPAAKVCDKMCRM